MWPSELTLGMTVTLNFQESQTYNLLHPMAKWCSCHKTKNEDIYLTLGIICSHQFWPWLWPWLLIFTFKLLTVSQKWQGRVIRNEKEVNQFLLSQQCDLELWPLALPSSQNFKVKFLISQFSGMGEPIAIEQKRCESVNHDCDHDVLVTQVTCKDLPDSNQGDFRCQCVVASSSYTPRSTEVKGGILVSPFLPVHLSICGQKHVHSVSSTRQIHFIFTHLIKQFQSSCRMKCFFKLFELGILVKSLNL